MYNKYQKPFIHTSRKKASRDYFAKKKKLKTKFLVILTLGMLLSGSAIYVLLFSGLTKIKNVEIVFDQNPRLISENEVKNMVYNLMNEKYLYFLTRTNLIFFSKERLMKLADQDSRINSMVVSKKWITASIGIKITEFLPIAKLKILGDNTIYYLNPNGQLIIPSLKNEIIEDRATENGGDNQLNNTKDTLPFTTLVMVEDRDDNEEIALPMFYDNTSTSLNNPKIIKLFKNLIDFINNDILIDHGIIVSNIEIDPSGGMYEVKINTLEGWYILIHSQVEFDKQINSLDLVLEKKFDNREVLKYIDLRFGEKIFYKLNN